MRENKKLTVYEFDTIIKDVELQKIFEITNGVKVYKLLEEYSSKYTNIVSKQNQLTKKLFLYYLKTISNSIKGNMYFYEDILLFLRQFLNEEIMLFLLSQTLDLSVGINNKYGYITLLESLALYTYNPKIMNMVLDKLDKQNFFVDDTGYNIDICRMNIIAHKLDTALEIFNHNNYKLFVACIDEKNIANELRNNKVLERNNNYCNQCNFDYDDNILSIVRILEFNKISRELKEDFLLKVLYNNKIKILNVEVINIIKNIFNKNKFNEFINYLIDSEIVLFEIDYKHLIYIDSKAFLKKEEKILKNVLITNNSVCKM